MGPNVSCWEFAYSHYISDGAVKFSNNLTLWTFPEVNLFGILNFTNAYTMQEGIFLDDLWVGQKSFEHQYTLLIIC